MQTPEGNWQFVGYLKEDLVQLGDLRPRHSFDGSLKLEAGQSVNNAMTYALNGRMAMNYLTGNYEYKAANYQQGTLIVKTLGSTKIAVSGEAATLARGT